MTLIKRLPNLLNDFLSSELNGFFRGGVIGANVPPVNIINNPDSFEVEIAAPGLQKGDIKVELNNHLLTVSADKEQKEEVSYAAKEFDFNRFERSFTLPEAVVEEEKIEGKYEAGILRLVIPKKEEAKEKPAKQIAIA